jgi:hypothetical protein
VTKVAEVDTAKTALDVAIEETTAANEIVLIVEEEVVFAIEIA